MQTHKIGTSYTFNASKFLDNLNDHVWRVSSALVANW